MDSKTIFTKTAKGLGETVGKTKALSRGLRKVLKEVDGQAPFFVLQDSLGMAEEKLQEALEELLKGDYIREFRASEAEKSSSEDDLDFTTKAMFPETLAQLTIGAYLRAVAEVPKDDADAKKAKVRSKDREGPATVRARWQRDAARYNEETVERAKPPEPVQPAPAPEAKNEQVRLLEEAARQAEKAVLQREAELKARREAEAQARKEAEEKARIEAEERAKREAEIQARREAEEKARAEAQAKARREAEERARKQAEEKARAEAEAKRIAEEKARREAEERARRESEEAARKQAEEKARQEAEAAAKKVAEEKARAEAEAEAKRSAEEKGRREAEEAARKLAEEKARQEAEAAARKAAEEKARREAEDKARREAEEKVRLEAEARAREEKEKARREAEAREKAEREAEEARRLAEEEARREAEEAARVAAELKKEQETRERALQEEQKRVEAELQKQKELRELEARVEAEKKRLEAERAAREDAEARARLEEEQRRLRREEEKAAREAEAIARKQIKEEERRKAQEEAERAAQERAKKKAEEDEQRAREQEAKRAAKEQARLEKEQEREARKQQHAAEREAAGPAMQISINFGIVKALAAGVLVLALAGVAAIPSMSFNERARLFEKAASAQFHQPVKIGSVHFALLPRLHWRIEDVTVGDHAQIKAREVTLNQPFGEWFNDNPVIESVEISSLALNDESMGWILFGKPQTGNLRLRHVTVSDAKWEPEKNRVGSFDVDAQIGDDGAWKSMSLFSNGRQNQLDLHPEGGAIKMELDADDFPMPFGAGFSLAGLHAVGVLRRDHMDISEFHGILDEGTVEGNANLDWAAGWSLQGEVHVKHMNAAVFAPAIFESGSMQSDAIFSSRSENGEQLFNAPHAEGNFTVTGGAVAGVDLMDLFKGALRGGHSAFSEFSGAFTYADGKTQLRGIRLKGGLVSAAGYTDVGADRNLNGHFMVDLKSDVTRAHADLAVSGTVKEPRFAR